VPDYLLGMKNNIVGLKIGLPQEYLIKGMDQRIKIKFEEACSLLKKLGAKLVIVSLPHTSLAVATYYIIQPAEVSSNLARYDGIRFGYSRSEFGDEAKRRLMLGTYTLSAGYYEAYYLKAMKVRTLIRKDFDQAFKKVDLLVAPISPVLPFRLGEKINDPLAMYLSDIFTAPINLAGVPSLALPIGFVENLPVGMQIIGPQFAEDLLFQVGHAYEQAK
jgi:aspartyl-tRNA(Asn)/glutamyl-tRNA(Gln) amidotransferase subunit A